MLHLGVELILVEERFKEDKNAGFNMGLVTKKQTCRSAGHKTACGSLRSANQSLSTAVASLWPVLPL